LIAQYWGKRDRKSIRDILSITLRFELVMGTVAAAVMLFFPQVVMAVMSNDPAVIELGSEFLRIAALNYFLFGMVGTIYTAHSSIEMVQVVFWGNTLCYSVNLALSWVLIPLYGVKGAALASVLARVVDFIFVVVMLLRNKAMEFEARCLLQFNRNLLGDYMQTVYPILGHEIIWSVGTNMSSILMGRLDSYAVSAYSIAYMLYSLHTAAYTGLAKAASAIVGKSIGEGDKERAQKSANTFVLLTLIVGLVVSASMFLLRPLFLSLYDLDPQVLEYANGLCMVLAVVLLFHGFDGVVLVSTLRAGGMGKIGFYTDIVVMWMIGIPLGWFAISRGINPIWVVALVKVDMPLKSIVGIYYVLCRDWIHNLTRSEDLPAAAQ
ncbi:MAG: MATE family efflux transporter, partial [Oscillospiraceae bacterium]|nr:MATE family efflux transporter [Oscillospiraceae bacterium]